jgi:hypothetical protein
MVGEGKACAGPFRDGGKFPPGVTVCVVGPISRRRSGNCNKRHTRYNSSTSPSRPSSLSNSQQPQQLSATTTPATTAARSGGSATTGAYRNRQQALGWQQQQRWLKQGGGSQGHGSWHQDRAQHWSSDHRTWAPRGGYGGYYIPQVSFGLYFGSQHFFRIRSLPTICIGGIPFRGTAVTRS